jgi:prephenate dehydratase
LGFSVPANVPGALVKPLEVFARRNINLRRIESRPTKRSLGEYIFFLDLEGSVDRLTLQEALAELANHTKLVKNFGSYPIIEITLP